MPIQTETRNAAIQDFVELLQTQHAAKVDMVVPMTAIRSERGLLRVKTMEEFDDYVTLRPTPLADGHLAERLGIPTAYLRRMREHRIDLYDSNVNGWIHGAANGDFQQYDPDPRSVLLRSFQGIGDEEGMLRAVLSDSYGFIDHLDVTMAALAGINESGINVEVLGADVTETGNMMLRLAAPDILVNADDLLQGYRSPWGGEGVYYHDSTGSGHYGPGELPQALQDKYHVDANGVCAGLVITNSETGGGACQIIPRILFLACANGAMIVRDAMRKVHLGSKLEEGRVKWSETTQQKTLELITSQATDAVKAFLDPEFVAAEIKAMTEKAGKPIADPAKTIEFVSKALAFTEEQQAGILDHFIRGGQVTAGGVMQAITSFSQTIADADTAFDMEANALAALDLAVAA